MKRSTIGYAILFSGPVGFGVAIAVLRTAKNFGVATLSGLVAAIVLFGFVLAVTTTGSPEVEPES